MKSIAFFFCCALIACFSFTNADAQMVHESSQFVGVGVGFNFSQSTVPIGANYEYMVKREFGIGGIFRYWSQTTFHYQDGGTYVWNTELIGAQGNYHFKVPQRELDPFMGIILGYAFNQGGPHNTIYTISYTPQELPAFIFAIQAGAQYFLTDNILVSGKLVFGSGSYDALEAGLEFAL